MYSMKDWRNKRNMMFDPSHYSVENYFTDIHQKKEMRHSYGDDLLNNLHLLPDPLKKNLADSIITSDETRRRPNKNFLNMETVENRFPEVEKPLREPEQPQMAPFSGISNFFSGVVNVITSAMSHWRPRSPQKYYDCFDESNVSRQGSPPSWQPASAEDQNKNERAQSISNVQTELKSDMNQDCRSAAAHCEDKLKKVRLMLSTKPVETPKFRSRRPRKVFVEPGSVEESFEDAFAPEDFVSVSNESYIECYSPPKYHQEERLQTAAPKMRTKVGPVQETTNIVEILPVVENCDKNCTDVKSDNLNCEPVKIENNCKIVENVNSKEKENVSPDVKVDKTLDTETITNNVPKETETISVENSKEELVSSCEDKLLKLKALLQERKKNTKSTIQSSNSAPELVDTTNDKVQTPSKTVPIEKSSDKRFKNPCRRTDKRRKTRLRKHIHDDMMFAHEINSDDLSSVENSPSVKSLDDRLTQRLSKSPSNTVTSPNVTLGSTPKLSVTPPSLKDAEYFDEVSGRFCSTSATESEDSFQIVFNDSPKTHKRLSSDCDSEDSFIVFEDSPDSCYTSNDVFGEESEEDSDYTDSDSDLSDSGCVPIAKLAHNLSRTIGDLTDTSLYDEKCVDEVDCAVSKVCEEIPSEDIVDDSEEVCETKDTGLLLTEAKKLLRKEQPKKKVQFSSCPPKVHVMRVWSFAARQARVGNWERFALDRDRFKRRIADVDMAVSWVLKPQHRSRVMFQRFMPWWNAQRRKEIAEKKARKEEEERKLAEEKEKEEERLRLEAERAESEGNDVNVTDVGTDAEVKQETGHNNVDSKSVSDKVENQVTQHNNIDFKPVSDKVENQVTQHNNIDSKSVSDKIQNQVKQHNNIDSKLVLPPIDSKVNTEVNSNSKELATKVVCNGDIQNLKSGNVDSKDVIPKVENVKGDNPKKVDGKCIKNEIKEQKLNVNKICNSKANNIETKIVPKKAFVHNGKIPSDAFKKFCNDKNVNNKSKDIKLDLKKGPMSGT